MWRQQTKRRTWCHTFGGRFKRAYVSAFKANGQKHLSLEAMFALADGMVAGTTPNLYDRTEEVFSFSLAGECSETKEPKPLVQGITAFEQLASQVAWVDGNEALKCFLLYRAYPVMLRHDQFRRDTPGGPSIEWTDYAKLRSHLLQQSSAFAQHLRTAYGKLLEAKKTPPSGKRGRHDDSPPPRKADAKKGKTASIPLSSKFRAPHDVPKSERKASFFVGSTFWVKGLDADEKKKLRLEKKCLLCRSLGHMMSDCPDRLEKFEKGEYFFYPKTLRADK